MLYIGAHVPITGGVWMAPERAAALGATAFGMFTKSPLQWSAPALTDAAVSAFAEALTAFGFGADQVLPHDSYLINLGHPNPEALATSRAAFVAEMQRCARLGLDKLNTHPGSHLGRISEADCLRTVAASIDHALAATDSVSAVIETTAGQGTSVGYSFEHLAAIIAGIEARDRVGVCLDTCHMFAAGYDLATADGCLETLREFGRVVGFEFLRGVHLNGARKKRGSCVDRHASLHEGELGLSCFEVMMNDDRFVGIPMILETPDDKRWSAELAMLREMVR